MEPPKGQKVSFGQLSCTTPGERGQGIWAVSMTRWDLSWRMAGKEVKGVGLRHPGHSELRAELSFFLSGWPEERKQQVPKLYIYHSSQKA